MVTQTNHWAPLGIDLEQGSRGPELRHTQHGVLTGRELAGERLGDIMAYTHAIDEDSYLSPRMRPLVEGGAQ